MLFSGSVDTTVIALVLISNHINIEEPGGGSISGGASTVHRHPGEVLGLIQLRPWTVGTGTMARLTLKARDFGHFRSGFD